jgi:hypothetical protein
MNIDALIHNARHKIHTSASSTKIDTAIDSIRITIANMVVERVQLAMEQAILGAQSILGSTCPDYIAGLYISDDCTIMIHDEVAYLEHGYRSRRMLDSLLSSVHAKVAKDGSKYLVVPVGQKQAVNPALAIGQQTSQLVAKGSAVNASENTLSQMVEDMQAVIRNTSIVSAQVRKERANQSNGGKKEFRTASSKQDQNNSWIHPGFVGVNQLDSINLQLRVDLEENAVRLLEQAIDAMRNE